MSTNKLLFTILAVGAVLLALGLGAKLAGAQYPAQAPASGITIPYSGRLSDETGRAVTDGAYAFVFTLYSDETGGELLWTETQEGVMVQGGAFAVLLGSANAIPAEALEGEKLWLAVAVRGPGEADFTALSPRQRVSALSSVASSAPASGMACPHDHWGETWSGSGNGLALVSSDGNGVVGRATAASGEVYGVYGRSDSTGGMGVMGRAAATNGENYGVYGRSDSASGTGVYGKATATSGYTYGVYGQSNSTDGYGVFGYATATSGAPRGVYGQSDSPNGYGVFGYATATSGLNAGVYGRSSSGDGYGVFGHSPSGIAIGALSGGSTRDWATIRARNINTNHGMAAYLTNNSDYHTVHLRNTGTNGGVLYLQNNGDASGAGGWDFISAQNKDETDLQFRVLSSGEVRSDVGFNTPASDFAEMLPAVEGLEPGDVLVVGADGKLARSTEAYQSTVVGVYSTQPGFVGGQPVEGEAPKGHIPLAVVGVVPVKASAENGSIRPGDLLVASSTPGHAMKAGSNPVVGTVIGKALEALESGTGMIQMLVMLQ